MLKFNIGVVSFAENRSPFFAKIDQLQHTVIIPENYMVIGIFALISNHDLSFLVVPSMLSNVLTL